MKNTNYSISEIEEYLRNAKILINKGKFFIPDGEKRKENRDFKLRYRLNAKKQKEMLLSIQATDFCYTVLDDDDLSEVLYIFNKTYRLDFYSCLEDVDVYIKMVTKKDNNLVVISFHKQKWEMKKLFEKKEGE